MSFDVEALRAEFPALARSIDGQPIAYFDGPGGTQVPQRVIDAVSRYYETSNANHGGAFETSVRSDRMVEDARASVADLLGAASPAEVKFGHNMTTLTFHVSRSIAATMTPGDEIVVTTLDHEANVAPWRAVAADRGFAVRTVDINADDVTLDVDELEAVLGPRTRLVAFGYASNAVGTINPVRRIVEAAHRVGALTYVDAVHYAPHGTIDVVAIGADFLVTSVYKWFGPHLGALYGRRELLDALPAYKVRPAHDRFETGTQSFEAIAGTAAAVDYLCSIGQRAGASADRRAELVAAMSAIQGYERTLAERMVTGLASVPGVRMWGIADPARFDKRTPTFAITIEGMTPREVAENLAREGIFAWDGDFYAQALIERLGQLETGGLLRLGIVHYNTADEVDRVLDALDRIGHPGRLRSRRSQPTAAAPA
jgi:cysteine desulfurase family protein (TIGR01976 family)